MVNIIALILLFFSFSVSSASLFLKLEKTTIEMGKYLNAKLIYTGLNNPGLADLSQWEQNFFIDHRQVETKTLLRGNLKITELLRLYPRKTGLISLDAIALGGTFMYPISLNIKPAIRKQIDATPKWKTLPKTVWQGQRFKVSVGMNLLHFSNHINIDNEDFIGFITEPLPQQKVTVNGKKHIVLSWYLTPKSIGLKQLSLPPIEQRGKGRWKFYLPQPVINIQPLPRYIPSTVPVGKLSIKSTIQNSNYWKVTVKNKGTLPQEVFGLRSSLAKAANKTVDEIEVSNPTINDNLSLTMQTYQVKIPSFSLGIDKVLTLTYFDVKEGRLRSISHTLPTVLAIPNWLKFVLFILILPILFYAHLMLTKVIQHRIKYRKLIVKINNASTVNALREAVMGSKQLIVKNKQDELLELLNQHYLSDKPAESVEQLKKTVLSYL